MLHELLESRSTTTNLLQDFCDGNSYKSHPLFSTDNQALQIIAYFDELEIANPLGSYVAKHKLGCIFFMLGNINPRYRSTHLASYLVDVAKSEDINHYGIDKFLQPFVDDLKTLYLDGIPISVNNEAHTFYGALLAFLGDNLAAHYIGGFKQNFSTSLRICRSCMVTPAQCQKVFNEANCLLRTPESHEEQCLLISGDLQNHYSKAFGINRRSILENVPGFSVVTGLPHDIMHDLYEGVVKQELKLFLSHSIEKNYFTIKELNQRICYYDFKDNRPSLIDYKPNDFKLRQSADQMINLFREFPMLIGDKIPIDERYYYSLLLLLQICSIVMCPSITLDTIPYLRVLIEEKFLSLRNCTQLQILYQRCTTCFTTLPKSICLVHL